MPRSFLCSLLLLVILLVLLLPCHIWAEADTSRVYIALNHTNMFPLAGPLAYYAEQSACDVTLMDTTKPTAPVFYQTQDGGNLRDALEQHGKFKEINRLITHTCDFLSTVGDHMDFSDGDVDLYLLLGYARQDMVVGDYDVSNDTFSQENLAGAYEKVTTLMLAHENLRLHFFWPSYEEPEKDRDMFDAVLQQRFGKSRVFIDISQSGKIDTEFIFSALERFLPANVSQTFQPIFDVDGQFSYLSGPSPQLVTLIFPDTAVPEQILFIPDEPQSYTSTSSQSRQNADTATIEQTLPNTEAVVSNKNAVDIDEMIADEGIPSRNDKSLNETESNKNEVVSKVDESDGNGSKQEINALTPYPSGNGIFWLYLPADISNGIFQVTYGAPDSVLPLPITMLTHTIPLHAAELTLRNAQGLSVTSDATVTLFNEPTSWNLNVRLEGFTAPELRPRLYAEILSNGSKHIVEADVSDNPIVLNDGTCCFEATLPPLGQSSSGTLFLEYEICGQVYNDAPLSVPFIVKNRAPILAQGVESPVQIDAYYDFEEFDTSFFTITEDMRSFFLDEDGDTLTFTIDHRFIESIERKHEFIDGILTYTALDGSNTPYALTVTATDPFGESATCTFIFTHVSANNVLDSLRATISVTEPAHFDQGCVTLPVYEETTLRFAIPGDDLKTLDQILSRTNLPTLYECLRLYADDILLSLEYEEDGTLSATLPITAQEHLGTQILQLSAQLVYPTGTVQDIPRLFESAQLQIATQNTPPYLQEGVETEHNAGTLSMSGLPSQYTSISLHQIFGSVIPGALFVNAEAREELEYVISVQGGDALLYESSSYDAEKSCDYEENNGARIFRIDGKQAKLPLDIRFYSPGNIHVEINVCDADGQFAAQSVSYHVKLVSSFIHLMIMIIIIIFLLASIAIVLLILRRKRMPTFEGCVACISNARTMNKLTSEPYTMLPLRFYGKDPVTVLALLVASGQMPLKTCSPDTLAHILLRPNNRSSIRVILSGQKDESVTVRVGTQIVSQSAILDHEEFLLIRTTDNEILYLRISYVR